MRARRIILEALDSEKLLLLLVAALVAAKLVTPYAKGEDLPIL